MNYLPINTKNKFFYKVRTFFYNLFISKNEDIENLDDNKTTQAENKRQYFQTMLSKDIKQQELESEILKYINDNPEIIYTLSNEKLLKLIRIIR